MVVGIGVVTACGTSVSIKTNTHCKSGPPLSLQVVAAKDSSGRQVPGSGGKRLLHLLFVMGCYLIGARKRVDVASTFERTCATQLFVY